MSSVSAICSAAASVRVAWCVGWG